MNPSKPKALIKLKYFFYSFLLKVNSNNKKYISKKIFYGSMIIAAGTALLSCNSNSGKQMCYKASMDSLDKYSKMKDSVIKAQKASAIKKADSLKDNSNSKIMPTCYDVAFTKEQKDSIKK